MASNTPRVRWVKCPKCLKVLPEFADVPVYKCGGCDTVLRAKNRGANAGEATSSGSLQNSSQNLSPEVMIDGGAERLASLGFAVSSSSTGDKPDRIKEPSDDAERATEGGNEMSTGAAREPEEGTQGGQGHSQDEQAEVSMKPSPHDCGSSLSRYKVEQPSEPIGIDAALPEGDMKLRAGSSHSYDGSVSSLDGSREHRLPDKILLLSRRTFRKKKGLDLVDKEERVQCQNLQGNAMDENSVSAIKGSFDSHGDELPSRLGIRTMERDTTFGSDDFHSIHDGIGSETTEEGASKSLSDDLLMHNRNHKPSAKLDCLEPDHVRILRKVDELRDELDGFLTRTVEGKGATQFKHREKFSRVPLSGQTACAPCLPHPHEMYCQANVPSYAHKAQTAGNEADKLTHRDKKPAVKNFCRPVSGGAPFVICYKCWKLLQLPADFLVARKRLHKLRCGACSAVLAFSFRPRDRTAPVTPVEVRHPPSEADYNNRRGGWDPISYSDDYGVSFVHSYSSEGEPALHVSQNSSYSNGGRDGRDVRGSQLHHLMGYSSASELLFKPRSVDSGYESTEPSTPHFYRPFEENLRHRPNRTGTINPTSTTEIEEEDEPQERLRTRRKGLALHGLLKKGVRELGHGLESVKLKIHPNK